ncbi:MAG: hypothetical protein IPL87_03635 [Candidatus Moraniibacteriota bacterium]|nr:MAG: hypothetical protein IPL87_03635 [Candidatus Moranbacteria bacterium]
MISRFSHLYSSLEFRLVAHQLVRDAIFLSLIALIGILSLESILPGTISLRFGIVFFSAGILLLLLAEQALAPHTLPPPKEKIPSKRWGRILFFGWSVFLFANALVGFHPIVLLFSVLATLLSFRLLLTEYQEEKTTEKNSLVPKESNHNRSLV